MPRMNPTRAWESCNCTTILEILTYQVSKNVHIDAVFSKALRILGQAELFEPVRDLLHRDPFQRIHRTLTSEGD